MPRTTLAGFATPRRRALLRSLPIAPLALFALVGAGPCSSDSSTTSPAASPALPQPPLTTPGGLSLPGSIVLAVGQSVRVDGRDAVVRFVRVTEDSRCPQGVECVWAGRARVELELTADGQPPPPPMALGLEVGAEPVEAAGLRLAAEALDPLPRAEVATAESDYRLRLRLEAAGG